jgi:predicted Rossmann fold nucleotide-binding protein DprA/Smf involved in DNA uptake
MLPTTPFPASALGLADLRSWPLAGVVPPAPRLAIVGSRAALRRVLAAIPAIVEAAADLGYSLVSGGARGVDRAVHAAALAIGAPQLAVLPCGPDTFYPPEHAALFTAVHAAPRSGVLFALAPGTTPARSVFASRNTIVLDACAAVIVAQANLRSGSWSTGRLALRRGLRIAAIASSPGCADLIARGAHSLALRDEPAATARAVATWLSGQAVHSAWPAELAWLHAAFLAAGPRGLGVDDLPDPQAACAALLAAELRGLVAESLPGRYHAIA